MPRTFDDSLDRRIVELIQKRVPLVREPYAQLAAELGCKESLLLERLAALGGPQDCVEKMRVEFEQRRNLMVEGMRKMGYDAIALGRAELRLPALELVAETAPVEGQDANAPNLRLVVLVAPAVAGEIWDTRKRGRDSKLSGRVWVRDRCVDP
jgi:hypothetical protein